MSGKSSDQRKKLMMRKIDGNPRDSSSNSNSSKSSFKTRKHTSTRMPKKSSIKSKTKKNNRNRISFREPLERSASSTSHNVWYSVSSKKSSNK